MSFHSAHFFVSSSLPYEFFICILLYMSDHTVPQLIMWHVISTAECLLATIYLQSEYPKYTPLLSKILEGLLSQKNGEDKIHHYEEVN